MNVNEKEHEGETLMTRRTWTPRLLFLAMATIITIGLSGTAYGDWVSDEKPAVITFVDPNNGNQWIYAFTTTLGDSLVVKYGVADGSAGAFSWENWGKLGLPPGATGVSHPSAVTYVVPRSQVRRMYVFVITDQGHLAVDYWNGANWTWTDLSAPDGKGLDFYGGTSAITFVDANGQQLIYVFAINGDGHLVVKYGATDGSQAPFSWSFFADQGLPGPGPDYMDHPAAITYADAAGKQHIDVFVRYQHWLYGYHWEYRLAGNFWNGFGWAWQDRGVPKDYNLSPYASPAPILFNDGSGNQLLYTFVTVDCGLHSCLAVNYGYEDGAGLWKPYEEHYLNSDPPPNATAATYVDVLGIQRIYAFVNSASGSYGYAPLALNSWDGSSWNYNEVSYGPSGGQLSAVTYAVGSNQLFYVFHSAWDGHLWVSYGPPLAMTSQDLGPPPWL